MELFQRIGKIGLKYLAILCDYQLYKYLFKINKEYGHNIDLDNLRKICVLSQYDAMIYPTIISKIWAKEFSGCAICSKCDCNFIIIYGKKGKLFTNDKLISCDEQIIKNIIE
jgi:hypothetical protein